MRLLHCGDGFNYYDVVIAQNEALTVVSFEHLSAPPLGGQLMGSAGLLGLRIAAAKPARESRAREMAVKERMSSSVKML